MEGRQSLWNAKPRRRQMNNLIDIFEDEVAEHNTTTRPVFPPPDLATRETGRRRSTTNADTLRHESIHQKPRRSSILVQKPGCAPEGRTRTTISGLKEVPQVPEVKKPPRRRTIYIPSEDTSIFTIHPGAPSHSLARITSPTQNTVLFSLPEDHGEPMAPPVHIAQPEKAPTRTSLTAAPRRAPFQGVRNSMQDKATFVDVAGKKTGKENIPPNQPKLFEDVKNILERKKDIAVKATDDTKGDDRKSIAMKPRRVSIAPRVNEGSRKRTSSGTVLWGPVMRGNQNTSYGKSGSGCLLNDPVQERRGVRSALSTNSTASGQLPPRPRRSSVLPKYSTKSESTARKSHQPAQLYPVLSEELERPELYEDHWLHHQEIALSQLINGIFSSHQKTTHPWMQAGGAMRRKILGLYSDPSITLFYKRLQASLLYGALSMSEEAMSRAIRIKDDIGLRRKFLNIWLDTYDMRVLQAGAEVVIGREIPGLSSALPSPVEQADRKQLEDFLEISLLGNQDALSSESMLSCGEDDFGSPAWSWRRMVTRSLLLIILLDRAKHSGTISYCLFRTTSEYKGSVAVLKAIADLILPSLGDVTRPLSHLDFQLQHVQYPLQEYRYHISNLAVDLRDGLMLTRLVELLLYPSGDLPTQTNGTITLALPAGEFLTSTTFPDSDDEESRVLSQHLKYPCTCRAQRLYNVQIAISALSAVKGMPDHILHNIKAEDIVDGHREKSLRLLWILVGRWGLGSLVDWNEMQTEVIQLQSMWRHNQSGAKEECNVDSDIEVSEANASQRHKAILKGWATSVGRLHGVSVHNLSTSFSDGRAFKAIVDEYWRFFPKSDTAVAHSCSSNTTPENSHLTVHAKLRLLGCSNAFIELIPRAHPGPTTSPTRILTSSTVIPTLAFLASRLLSLSRVHCSATKIQRAYRRRRARQEISKRLVSVRLAHHCAHIVQTRNRVVHAATVLQRAWRKALETRIRLLQGDIVRVQALIRGWRTRRNLRLLGKETRRRFVGVGW